MDPGRMRISTAQRDRFAFKTPTLRDVTRRGPYMHNGDFKTLAAVIHYYAGGGSDDEAQDKRIKAFTVNDQEVADLVAFLESLTGDDRPGRARADWSVRPEETKLRFLDAAGKPMAGLEVELVPEGDVLPGARARAPKRIRRTTDERGVLRYLPPSRTHMRLFLPGGIETKHGPLVPDVCARADIHVPVRGRCSVVAVLAAESVPPEALTLEHLGTLVLPGHTAPRTRFARSKPPLKTGDRQIVRYDAWMRTDVPPKARVLVPGRKDPLDVTLSAKEPARVDLR